MKKKKRKRGGAKRRLKKTVVLTAHFETPIGKVYWYENSFPVKKVGKGWKFEYDDFIEEVSI